MHAIQWAANITIVDIFRNFMVKWAISLTRNISKAAISLPTCTNLISLISLKYRVSLIMRKNLAD